MGDPPRQGSLPLTFRGVRGSIPTPDASHGGYGGNTCCLEVALSSHRRLLIDCGSGLREVAHGLPGDAGSDGLQFDVLMTHFHWDHIMGLPFFQPLYDRRNHFTFYGVGWERAGVRAAMEGAIRPPWFPVALADAPCRTSYVDLDGQAVSVGGLRIRTARLSHPQGVTAFRLDGARGSVVFATDVEGGDTRSDTELVELASGADVLIHDSQYTPEEYERQFRGWGHSTWRHAAQAARRAGVGHLILFHHDPDRTDEQLDAIVQQAAAVFPDVEAAREGRTLQV